MTDSTNTAELDAWKLPDSVQAGLSKIQDELQTAVLELGAMEASYRVAKTSMLAEIDKRAKARVEFVTAAAKEAGLDTEAYSWRLDSKSMTLVREQRQSTSVTTD